MNTFTKLFIKQKVNPSLALMFILIFIFSIWSNPGLKSHISPDGLGYWSIAENFTAKEASLRPFLFPLFLKAFMSLFAENWQLYFTLFQLMAHSVISSILFVIYKKYSFSDLSASICTLAVGFNPNLIYYASYLLADILLAILTTVVWILLLYFNDKLYWNNKLIYLISFFCALCIVTKPVALLMIFPVTFSIIIVKGLSYQLLKSLPLIIIINFSFHTIWETYKLQHHSDKNIVKRDLLFGAVNWTAIKSGMVEKGHDTPLYNALKEKGQIERAKKLRTTFSYTMDDDPEFRKVFASLADNWAIKSDNEFALKIMKQAPLDIFLFSSMKWHSFFTKRAYYPPEGSFPKMPQVIKTVYAKTYAYLYRPLLLILIFVSIVLLFLKNKKNLLFSSLLIIFYASAVVNFASASGNEFARYRVWIEYIMWFFAFYPIGFYFNNFQKKFKTIRFFKLSKKS